MKGEINMYNVFLNKEAKKDLKENNLDEKAIVDSIQEAFKDKKLLETQDILVITEMNDKALIIAGRKNKTTITISDIVSNVINV